MARQHHISSSASQPLTSAEKSKATKLARREAQRLQDEADASAASRLRKYTLLSSSSQELIQISQLLDPQSSKLSRDLVSCLEAPLVT